MGPHATHTAFKNSSVICSVVFPARNDRDGIAFGCRIFDINLCVCVCVCVCEGVKVCVCVCGATIGSKRVQTIIMMVFSRADPLSFTPTPHIHVYLEMYLQTDLLT